MTHFQQSAEDARQRRRGLHAAIHRRLLSSRAFLLAVQELRRIAPDGSRQAPNVPPETRDQRGEYAQQSPAEAMFSRFVPADVNEVHAHVAKAREFEHPEALFFAEGSLAPSLARSVRHVARWGDATPSERRWRRRRWSAVTDSLWPLTHELRAAFSPPCVLAAADVSLPHAALFAACSYAFGLDRELVDLLLCGADCVGEIDPSGFWHEDSVPASLDFDGLDHEYWNEWLMNDIREKMRSPSADERARADAVWEKTLDEEEKGYIRRSSLAELAAKYGAGFWRAIRRFGVLQKGKTRPCENAAESGHNAASAFAERISCETADLPVRIAAAFAAVLGESGSFGMALGTDDLAAAYRRVLVSTPQYTVVAVWGEGDVVLFEMPGFNFGLHSAVMQFNRVSHAMCEVVRRVFAVCAGHYYDDYVVCEPSFARDSGQDALNAVLTDLGYPASGDKHEPMRSTNSFLGVEHCFDQFLPLRLVTSGVDAVKAGVTADMIAAALEERRVSHSLAAKRAGMLAFACAWATCRLGRAALQPVFRRTTEHWSDLLDPALELALRFFLAILTRPGGPPRRRFDLRRRRRPTVKIWTDAAAGERTDEIGRVGFVVLFPEERVVGVDGSASTVPERWVHGSAPVPDDFVARFRARKQYIGQFELLGAVCVYHTLREDLRDRHVVHYIDNMSAMAALVKGYSRALDSARIVHALHAWNAGVRVSAWFEYVPSKANIADLPSRSEFRLLNRMRSEDVGVRLPGVEDWFEPAAAWLDKAEACAAPDRRERGGKRRRRR